MNEQAERVNQAYDYAIENVGLVAQRRKTDENYRLDLDIKNRFALCAFTAERLAKIAYMKSDGDWYRQPSNYD